jgi:hypothetical protein
MLNKIECAEKKDLYLEKLPYDLFIYFVLKSDFTSNDVLNLCKSSLILNEYCERSFQLFDSPHIEPQYLFKKLLEQMGYKNINTHNMRDAYKYISKYYYVPAPKAIKGEISWVEEYKITKEINDNIKTYNNYISNYSVTVNTIDRTGLCEDLKKYWVGKDESCIGLSMDINWKTRKMIYNEFVRKDIFQIQYDRNFTYLEPYMFDLNVDCSFDNFFEKTILYHREFFQKILSLHHKEFLKRQLKWYKENNLKALDGKTPEEGVKYLETKGWC